VRRFLLGAVFLAAVLAAGLYFSSGMLLESVSHKALNYLAAQGEEYGLQLKNPHFQKVGLSSPDTVTWSGVSAKVRMKRSVFFSPKQDIALDFDKVSLSLEDFRNRTFHLDVQGISIAAENKDDSSADDTPATQNQIEGKKFTMQFPLDFLRPKKAALQIRYILDEMGDLLQKGRCALSLYFSGSIAFPIKNRSFTARISIQREEGKSFIIMNELDLIAISQEFELKRPLTEEEVKILSRNPFRARRLLQIRNYARSTSKRAHKKNRFVPKDAYRHVLWSYLLTKEYGEEFAKKVTDAHEKGLTGNTEEERLMDINNNTVGRRYALRGLQKSMILKLVMIDPDVIRSPEQVGRKEILQ